MEIFVTESRNWPLKVLLPWTWMSLCVGDRSQCLCEDLCSVWSLSFKSTLKWYRGERGFYFPYCLLLLHGAETFGLSLQEAAWGCCKEPWRSLLLGCELRMWWTPSESLGSTAWRCQGQSTRLQGEHELWPVLLESRTPLTNGFPISRPPA